MKRIIIENPYFGTKPFAFHYHGDVRHHARNKYFRPLFYQGGEVWNLLSEGLDIEGWYKDHKHTHSAFPILPKGETHPVNDELHTFTISNLPELGTGSRTMDYYGIEYDVQGRDIEEYDHDIKILELIEYIPTIEKPYTMFFDSSDIVFTSPPDGLLADFKERPESMLFNADGWSFPRGSPTLTWEEHISASRSPKSPYRYLNSGLWIACTDFLKEELHPALVKYRKNWDIWENESITWEEHAKLGPYTNCDQGIFKHIYKDLYPEMIVDHSCRYFHSMAWGPWFDDHYPEANELRLLGSEEIQ